jgi:hypothetical protein
MLRWGFLGRDISPDGSVNSGVLRFTAVNVDPQLIVSIYAPSKLVDLSVHEMLHMFGNI